MKKKKNYTLNLKQDLSDFSEDQCKEYNKEITKLLSDLGYEKTKDCKNENENDILSFKLKDDKQK